MDAVKKSILRAVVYADTFDYPLTKSEAQKWAIKTKDNLIKSRNILRLKQTFNYYHLQNRSSIVKLRQQREYFSNKKLKLANKIINCLKFIPSIQLIAITGALAMKNSDKTDDIDLMIITKKNRLWIVRILCVLFLELIHIRRRPSKFSLRQRHHFSTSSDGVIPSLLRGVRKIKQKLIANSNPQNINPNSNKICLNLFLDKSALLLNKNKQNLYTAHEILQIEPIFNKNNTYQKFIKANSWTKNYLPNAYKKFSSRSGTSEIALRDGNLKKFLEVLLSKINLSCFYLQYAYMKSKITNEKISLHYAFFHPRPTSNIILKKYHQKL